MKSKFLKKLFPISLVVIVVVIGVTSATILHKMTLENPIKTPTVSGSVEENDSSKHVFIKNTGEADVFVRAAYSETWLYTEDSGKSFIVLPNETELKDADGNLTPVAVPAINDTDWIDGGDGWYYYRYILCGSANQTGNADYMQTTNLINGVSFDNIDSVTDKRYAATKTDEDEDSYSDYQIHVVTEVVQASDEVAVSIDAVQQLFIKDITLINFSKNITEDGRIVISSGKYTSDIDWPTNN